MDQPTQPGFYLYTTTVYGTTPSIVYGTPPALQSRTPWAYGNGPVAQLPGQWEPWIDPAVLASAEQRIQELEAEVIEVRQALTDARRTEALAVAEMNHMRVAALWETVTREYIPHLRAALDRLMDKSARVSHGNINVIEMFDAAVAQVQERPGS